MLRSSSMLVFSRPSLSAYKNACHLNIQYPSSTIMMIESMASKADWGENECQSCSDFLNRRVCQFRSISAKGDRRAKRAALIVIRISLSGLSGAGGNRGTLSTGSSMAGHLYAIAPSSNACRRYRQGNCSFRADQWRRSPCLQHRPASDRTCQPARRRYASACSAGMIISSRRDANFHNGGQTKVVGQTDVIGGWCW
jgi:hypothetical protein